MNKTNISRERILEVSTQLLLEGQQPDLNMRSVARECGVAVGSIYNYFPTKAELVVAVVEGVWNKVFHPQLCRLEPERGFLETVEAIYSRACLSKEKYSNFFLLHRTLLEEGSRAQGKNVMGQYFGHIQSALLCSLAADRRIPASVWTPDFTQEELVKFVFLNMMSLLSGNAPDCKFLLRLLDRVLSPK